MIGSNKLAARLAAVEQRLERIEALLESIARESALRDELAAARKELDQLGQQSLHVVELLTESRRRIHELEDQGR